MAMTRTEITIALDKIDKEAKEKKAQLCHQFAVENNNVEAGDILEDHMGSIIVNKFQVLLNGRDSHLLYYGEEITKAGKPKKKQSGRGIYPSNIKKWIRGGEELDVKNIREN